MKFICVLCLVCSLLLSGCEVLSAPFNLIKELLPLAIKYAPYALMFLEEPDADSPAYADVQQFKEQIALLAQENSLQLPDFYNTLTQEANQRKGKLQYVVALHLENAEKVEQIQNWLMQHEQQFRITYYITAYDTSHPEQFQQTAAYITNCSIPFIADGPLSSISTAAVYPLSVIR